MATYTLTRPDILRYLATKKLNEVVGEPMRSKHCLGAETLAWKYPVEVSHEFALEASNEEFFYVHTSRRDISCPIPQTVTDMLNKFDALFGHHEKVTLRQLYEYNIVKRDAVEMYQRREDYA